MVSLDLPQGDCPNQEHKPTLKLLTTNTFQERQDSKRPLPFGIHQIERRPSLLPTIG